MFQIHNNIYNVFKNDYSSWNLYLNITTPFPPAEPFIAPGKAPRPPPPPPPPLFAIPAEPASGLPPPPPRPPPPSGAAAPG